jgi:hypothetical protein
VSKRKLSKNLEVAVIRRLNEFYPFMHTVLQPVQKEMAALVIDFRTYQAKGDQMAKEIATAVHHMQELRQANVVLHEKLNALTTVMLRSLEKRKPGKGWRRKVKR